MKYHSLRHRLLRQRRFRQMLFACVMLSVLIALVIVPVENQRSDSSIRSFSDGLWWAVQTATTVGYGDVTPITEVGRVLGIIMQILGTIMFGSIVAMISTNMSRGQEEMYWTRLFDRLDTLTEQVERVEHEARYLVRSEVEPGKTSSSK